MRQQATVGAQHAASSRLPPRALRLVRAARIAHLATSDKSGQPHVVPICFAFDGKCFYSPIDEKPKHTAPAKLKRMRNIAANAKVALVIDHYEEDWRKLAYVLIFGPARIVWRGNIHLKAVRLLRRKYRQYRAMAIHQRPIIAIAAERFVVWRSGLEMNHARIS